MNVEDVTLRTWNQCAEFFNLMTDQGMDAAKTYAENLTKESRGRMYAMYQLINSRGYNEVKAAVNRGEVEIGSVH